MSVPVDLEELTITELFALSRENPAELAAGLDGDSAKPFGKMPSLLLNLSHGAACGRS